MDASIDFSGVLRGSIADEGGGGGGDTVVITPIVTSGTKIADVSVNGVEKDLYCPNSPEVNITPLVTSGTKIADVSVGGVEKDLYAPNPTQVSVNQVQQSGTKIATIGVNGVNTDLYAPNSSGGINYSTNEKVVGTWVDGRPLYQKTFIFNQQVIADNEWTNNILGTRGSGIEIVDYDGFFGLLNIAPRYAKFNYYRSNSEFFTTFISYTTDDLNVRPNMNAGENVTLDRCTILYIKDSDS